MLKSEMNRRLTSRDGNVCAENVHADSKTAQEQKSVITATVGFSAGCRHRPDLSNLPTTIGGHASMRAHMQDMTFAHAHGKNRCRESRI